MSKKKDYDDDLFDNWMALDVPFDQLNKKGRKAKKKLLKLDRLF